MDMGFWQQISALIIQVVENDHNQYLLSSQDLYRHEDYQMLVSEF